MGMRRTPGSNGDGLDVPGNTSGCNGFETQYRWKAATISFSVSSPPSSEGVSEGEGEDWVLAVV